MASSSESGSLLYIKKLECAHNYAIWKKQCYNVMLQKKQAKPIKTQGVKPENMTAEEWEEVDKLARSTIMFFVSDSLLFNVENEDTTWGMWKRLEDLYAQQSAASKEGTQMSVHLNEFNSIFSQLTSLKFEIDEEFKATFLLSLSSSNATSTYADVVSSLLMEEMKRKNTSSVAASNALHMRGRSQRRDNNDGKGKRRSKSRSEKDVMCHHCGKKGHYKRECYAGKKEKSKEEETHAKDKGKTKKSSVVIEGANMASGYVPYGQPQRPNVQQRFDAENQQTGAESQPNDVAIDEPQIEEEDAQRQPFDAMQPDEQPADFDDLQAENPPAMDHLVRRSTRETRPPDRYVPSMDYVMLIDCGEPSCYKEAVS
ncbi:hypothetical protein KP509_08G067200 [Ceratopteris richardii]|uniref:CCHC-type domain-containing protein n=1 Tax=Ceratopteris richardii TaxID=49495 RepID=A0A8T2UDC9_CERRI|nr:hypothetical protein KP509_08G067200 [Ceratopteris richardii]